MKLPDKRLIFINGILFAGSCILTAAALLTPQSNLTIRVALLAGPLFVLFSGATGTWLFFRETRSRKIEMGILRHAFEGKFPENMDKPSPELAKLIPLFREEQSRIHRILADHGETSKLVSMNLERVIRLTDRMGQFIGDIDKFASKIYHLYQRLENALLQADNREDLSETVLKIRFELDHFNEAPAAMLDLLKKVYSSCRQNREALIAAQEGFLGTQSVIVEGEIDIVTKQQKAMQQTNNAVHNLEEDFQNIELALQIGKESLEGVAQRFQNFSNEVGEVHSLSNKLPEQILNLSTLLTELKDVHEKSKILALNAAIYAGDAGEEGKGFSTIAREMKTVTESAELLRHQLRQGLAQLEKISLHTIGGIEQLISTEGSIEKFSEERQEKYTSTLSNRNSIWKNDELLSNALRRLGELLDIQEKTAKERQTNLAQMLSGTRNSQEGNETEQELKFQIDSMVIETDRFSERIESELPKLLDAVGGILDEVSAFQDQFLQTRNALADFANPQLTQTLKELKQAMGGNEIQLLRSSTNLLLKMTHKLPSN